MLTPSKQGSEWGSNQISRDRKRLQRHQWQKDKTDHQHENRIAMVTQTQNESLYFPLHLPTPPPDASRLPRERHPAEMLLLRIFKSSLEVSSFESILFVSPWSLCWSLLTILERQRPPAVEKSIHPTEDVANSFVAISCSSSIGGFLRPSWPPHHHPFDSPILRWRRSRHRCRWNECMSGDRMCHSNVHQSPKWDCQTRK